MKNQIACLLCTTGILINSTLHAESINNQEQPVNTDSTYEITKEDTIKQYPNHIQDETSQQELNPYPGQEISAPTDTQSNTTQPSIDTHQSSVRQETETTNHPGSENQEITTSETDFREAQSSNFVDQQPTEQSFQTPQETPKPQIQQNNLYEVHPATESIATEYTTVSTPEHKKTTPHQNMTNTETRQTETQHNMIINASPWETFLIQTITIIRMIQTEIQSYSNLIFSKQGIPLLIIMFGLLLLSTVLWFAYSSFKQEQTSRINNLVKKKQGIKNNNKPQPLSVAYAEEESGDYDIFATSEGIPIKLDLAQAYINMQDLEGAKTILQDIIRQHRGKTVTTAQEMLRKINLAT